MSDTTKKGKKGRRLDKNRITLKKGEYQRPDGVYSYRWTSRYGQRHEVYAGTLEELRRKEEQIKLDIADGIRMDIMSTTVNDLFDLWCDLKRGLKDNTLQNYKYMYNMFVRPTFGKIRVVSVKKSDVKRFYNNLCDEKILKVSTIDTIHNICLLYTSPSPRD